MDYHAVHGHDISSFELPSTHRLPTISAAQALEDLDGNPSRFVPTGLDGLDRLLVNHASDGSADRSTCGGIQKGQVTEIWGPPGAGKTILGIQLCSAALAEGRGVVWVDGFSHVCSQRLAAVVAAKTGTVGDETGSNHLRHFIHYTCPTLSHFVALLCRPTDSCIPGNTSLVVIDSLSALLNHNFPRVQEGKGSSGKGPSQSSRRLQILRYIIDSLQKLAATRDIAVVVLTQCATKMQAERGAALIPAINASVWEQGVFTRLVLFRDWGMHRDQPTGLHFAGAQKVNGKGYYGSAESMVAFRIETSGLVAVKFDSSQAPTALSATPAPKRKLRETDFEVADSEDEDYGWQVEDEDAMPDMPSQWQGSEDLLLNQHPESEDGSQHEDEDGSQHEDEDGSQPEDEEANSASLGDPYESPSVDGHDMGEVAAELPTRVS